MGKAGDAIFPVSAMLNNLLAKGAGPGLTVSLQGWEVTHKGTVRLAGKGSTAHSRS